MSAQAGSGSMSELQFLPNVSAPSLLTHLMSAHLPHSQLDHSMQTRMKQSLGREEVALFIQRPCCGEEFPKTEEAEGLFLQEFELCMKQSRAGQDSGAELCLQSARNVNCDSHRCRGLIKNKLLWHI